MNKFLNIIRKYKTAILILGIFLVWMMIFWQFLSTQYKVRSDAMAYYEHFEFFIRNISHGDYPMWESTRQGGVPAEFFMRRIGAYNPFFLLCALVFKLTGSFDFAYFAFLGFYYFLGIVGFYFLSQRIFNNDFIALVACSIFTFSCIGTRLFDSYILLTIVPLIWFFVFFISFVQKPSREFFLGVIFTAIVLLTTYIPFYFFMIFVTFCVSWGIVYMKEFKFWIKDALVFLQSHKIFVGVCVFMLILSLIPGYIFFLDSKKGDIVLPVRTSQFEAPEALEPTVEPISQEEEALRKMGIIKEGIIKEGEERISFLEIDVPTITHWGMMEDLAFSSHHLDLRRMKFAIIYMPLFAIIALLFAPFNLTSRKTVFFLLWTFIIFLLFSPYGPVYLILNKNVFFFKYFRNLHFFLWMAVLPIFILFVCEQFSLFLRSLKEQSLSKRTHLIIVMLVHCAVLAITIFIGGSNLSSLITIALSFILFVLLIEGILKADKMPLVVLILICIAIQPVEAYHYLKKNLPDDAPGDFRYSHTEPYREFSLSSEKKKEQILFSKDFDSLKKRGQYFQEQRDTMYMGIKWYDIIRSNLHPFFLGNILNRRILLFDRFEEMDEEKFDAQRYGKAVVKNENIAFLPPGTAIPYDRLDPNPSEMVELVTDESEKVKLISSGLHTIKLKTNLDSTRLLVHNNNFYKGWQAFIDGKATEIIRANLAFKGIWVPAGEHIVTFRYGENWRYLLNYSMIVLINVVFYWMLILFVRKFKG